VTASYSINGERHETTGVGYHDHNWGNVGLMKVVHDWYWARGQAGPYNVIASYITASEAFGFEPIPIFMLARDKVLVGDDPAKVTFEREGALYRSEDRQARCGDDPLHVPGRRRSVRGVVYAHARPVAKPDD
jgi:hypothetical protein